MRELEEQIERTRKINATLQSEGWAEIRKIIDRLRTESFDAWASGDDSPLNKAKAAVLKELMDQIREEITRGEDAKEKLKSLNEEENRSAMLLQEEDTEDEIRKLRTPLTANLGTITQ